MYLYIHKVIFMSVDYESNLLFWVDAKLHVICSSNLLGGDRRVILTSYVYLKHPFALTVFEVSGVPFILYYWTACPESIIGSCLGCTFSGDNLFSEQVG